MAKEAPTQHPYTIEWSMRVPLAARDVWASLEDEVYLNETADGFSWPEGGSGVLLLRDAVGVNREMGTHVESSSKEMHLRFRSRPQGWADGAESVVDIDVIPEGIANSRLAVCAHGWTSMIGPFAGNDAREMLAFTIGQVLVPLTRAVSQASVGDWLTARMAGKPQGMASRAAYAAPEMHMEGFRAILDHLQLAPNDHLLEIGFGGGYLLQSALRTGCTAVGIDHSPEMVRLAADQNRESIDAGRLTLIQADGERPLPLADKSVTAVAMATVFFFFQRPTAVLTECRRVLRPGGRLAVFTIPPEFRGTPASPEPMASRGHHYHDLELEEIARNAGFSDVVVRRADNGGQLLTAHA